MKPSEERELFTSIFEEFKENSSHSEGFDPFSETFLTDEIDHTILQHRDAHFAGDFKVMHNYYQKESNRLHPDIELERIEYLAKTEAELEKNLADTLLSEQEKSEVKAALHAYEKLKELYTEEKTIDPITLSIADLILSEEEEEEEKIAQVINHGEKIAKALIKIIKSKEAYNPLFPGYGYAPYLATQCLGKLQEKSAIIPLFQQLSEEALYDEQFTLTALKQIGEPAKKYLLEVLRSRPINKENINAAYALTCFSDDVEVAKAAFENLQDKAAHEHTLFITYLIYNLDALKTTPLKEEIIAWSKRAPLSNSLRQELIEIVANWN